MKFHELYSQLNEAFLSKNKNGGFNYNTHNIGQEAEDNFKKQAEDFGYKVTTATQEQDRAERWDFDLMKPGGKFNGKVDVKSTNGYTTDRSKIYIKLIGEDGHGAEWTRNAKWIGIQTPLRNFLMFKRLQVLFRIGSKGNFIVHNPDSRNCYLSDHKGEKIQFDERNSTRNRDYSLLTKDRCIFHVTEKGGVGLLVNLNDLHGTYDYLV